MTLRGIAGAAWLAVFALPSAAAGAQSSSLTQEIEAEAAKVIREAGPSVVGIRVEREAEKKPPMKAQLGFADLTGGPFRFRPDRYVCSGTIIDSNGLVLTSYFNVEGAVNKIVVILHNGAEQEAELLGYDRAIDVALLKIPTKELPTLKCADPRLLRVGQAVYVLGRNPGGAQISLGGGVISALDRFAGKMVQMDVDTNFSNAGGALVDAKGNLVGVVAKIDTRHASAYGQNSGVSFAATWDKIEEALPRLKMGEKVAVERKPFLGVSYDNASPDTGGVVVEQVHPNTAAMRAGLKEKDVIVEFDGVKVRNSTDLVREILKHKGGDTFKVKVLSGGAEKLLQVTLGDRVVEE